MYLCPLGWFMAFTCSRLTDNENETIVADWSHDNTGYLKVFPGNSSRIWEHRGYLEILAGNSSRIFREATNQGAFSPGLLAFIAVEYAGFQAGKGFRGWKRGCGSQNDPGYWGHYRPPSGSKGRAPSPMPCAKYFLTRFTLISKMIRGWFQTTGWEIGTLIRSQILWL